MRRVFADTGYWIAILDPADVLNPKAMQVSCKLGQVRIHTTEMVLAELANYFAEKGDVFRKIVGATVKSLQEDPNVTIVPQTSKAFREALNLYAKRIDKGWSLTDCASMLAMQDLGIMEALSGDRHFSQMGFSALLRDE